jgi:hypothetical protein
VSFFFVCRFPGIRHTVSQDINVTSNIELHGKVEVAMIESREVWQSVVEQM